MTATRAAWTAPGNPAWQELGWKCPACGQVERDTCRLFINHGYGPLATNPPNYNNEPGWCHRSWSLWNQGRFIRPAEQPPLLFAEAV